MTRKQAILLGISILEKNNKNKEIVEKLLAVAEEYPYKHWSKDAVFDAIEQFQLEHNGRYPNATDFRLKSLPSHTTIKNLFKMTVVEFLDFYYPNRSTIAHSRFNHHSTYYWMEDFKKTYLSINNGKHVNQVIYDRMRNPGSPCTQTLMKMFQVNMYNDLIRLAGLDGNNLTIKIISNS